MRDDSSEGSEVEHEFVRNDGARDELSTVRRSPDAGVSLGIESRLCGAQVLGTLSRRREQMR